MEHLRVPQEKVESPAVPRIDALLAQKQQIRALKRVLIAKAEVRRLKSLMGRRRIASR